MNGTTAYNHQERLIGRVKELYSRARLFRLEITDFLELKKKLILNDPAWGKLPNHARCMVHGYERALWEDHQANTVVWVLPFNGTNYLKWEDLPEEGKQAYRENKITGVHVYKSDMLTPWDSSIANR